MASMPCSTRSASGSGAAQKETVTDLLRQHIDRFIARSEAEKSLTAEKTS